MFGDSRWGAAVLGLMLLAPAGGCVQDSGKPGAFNSPSELGLALTLTASPDILPLNGTAQSLIAILARDANGGLVPNLQLLLQIETEAGLADIGQLSSREVTTGSDGRAAATYTVPLQSTSSGAAADDGVVVTILVTPIGDNFDNSTSRALSIRLVPAGAVIPPFNATAGFGFSPESPAAFDPVLFTTACPDDMTPDCVRDPLGLISSYLWSFGDGQSGSGPTASHSYAQGGTYLVKLTIEDAYGRSLDVTRAVVVGGGTPPTAVVTVSPTNPNANDQVFFNAAGSTAATGRTLVSYAWDFGDGSVATGVSVSNVYDTEGTYVVTLTVEDDQGQLGTATAQVTVGTTGPTAEFVFSPAGPTAGQAVFFDGRASQAGPGRDITQHRWSFGDGSVVVQGPRTNHRFLAAGVYTVQLTIRNNAGEEASVSQDVTVAP
jgi:PKD repeat protein